MLLLLAVVLSACSAAQPPAMTVAWTGQVAGLATDARPLGIVYRGLLIVETSSGLAAYSQASGHPIWTWQEPAALETPNGSPFYLADDPASGVAVAFTSSALDGTSAGTQLAAVDLADGRTAWLRTGLPEVSGTSSAVEVGSGVVAVSAPFNDGDSPAPVSVYSLATGDALWSTADQAAVAGCAFASTALADGILYADAFCPVPDAAGGDVIYEFGAASGDMESTTKIGPSFCGSSSDVQLWPGSGFVLANCDEASHPGQLGLLRGGTGDWSTASYPGSSEGLNSCSLCFEEQYATDGNTVYFQSQNQSRSLEYVTAVDMADARTRWQQAIPSADVVDAMAGSPSGVTVVLADSQNGVISTEKLAVGSGAVTSGPQLSSGMASAAGDPFLPGAHTLFCVSCGTASPDRITAYGLGALAG
jgi:hypothetical protein